jgi:hypothetical protein
MPHRPLFHLPLAILVAIASCSDQGEGERCDVNSGNKDCASGLFCVPALDLADKSQGDRCCPETLTASTDARCRRGGATNTGGSAGAETAGAAGEGTGGATMGGSPGSGGTGAEAGTAGTGATPCLYNSDCLAANEVCGPTGYCRLECNQDKDCSPPLRCDVPNHMCVTSAAGGAGGAGGAGP